MASARRGSKPMSRRCDRCRLTRSCCRNRKPQPTSNVRSDYAAERFLLSRSPKAPPDWPAGRRSWRTTRPLRRFRFDFAVNIGCVPSRVGLLGARNGLVWRSRAAGTALDRIEALNPTFNHHRAAEPRRPPDGGAAAQSEFADLRSGPERSARHVCAAGRLAPSEFIAATTVRETGATPPSAVHSTPRLVGRRDSGRASLA